LQSRKEVSGFQAAKRILTAAGKWLELLILSPEEAKPHLNGVIRFIMKRCVKIPQKGRVYPLELVDKLSGNCSEATD
ncbi:MAG: hypothetical protein GY862_09480, partial [Gammaproteobacteria bacterium]|nr:hypothetical protein [Gammaproteobacteria bacterium]